MGPIFGSQIGNVGFTTYGFGRNRRHASSRQRSRAFRNQLFSCIHACDARWPQEAYWQSPQGAQLVNDELAIYPLLAKYFNAIKFFPKRNSLTGEIKEWPDGINWVTFPMRGGVFSRDTMFEPLRELISAKINHYAGDGLGFDDLTLLVSYN